MTDIRAAFEAGYKQALRDAVVGFDANARRAAEEYVRSRSGILVIDPGHGGHDPGAVSGGVRESDLVNGYASALGGAWGGQVAYTRLGDESVTLPDRARFANDMGADVFVSLHANASTNTDAHGFQVFHCAGSEKGRALAECVMAAALSVVGESRWRGVFPDDSPQCGNRKLHVLRATKMPAVLVELGFLTNDAERAKLVDPEYQRSLSEAIASGIRRFVRDGR